MDKDIRRKSRLVMSNEEKGIINIENPFSVKVGQVFTGFGIGCGIGIGVGRPINLSAIPMLNQVMGAASGATHAFSGVGRHVNNSLRKFGVKNLEAGVGCGIGFGYGFGAGVAVKPRVLHQIQSCLVQMVMTTTKKLGMSTDSIGQGVLPVSLQSGTSTIEKPSNQNPAENAMQWKSEVSSNSNTSQGLPDASFARTEKVISSFLQNPLLKEENTGKNDLAARLQTERSLLRMVLNHQQIIDELREENENLRQVLVEHLKVPPTKLRTKYPSHMDKSPCTDCFDCRRKQRKR